MTQQGPGSQTPAAGQDGLPAALQQQQQAAEVAAAAAQPAAATAAQQMAAAQQAAALAAMLPGAAGGAGGARPVGLHPALAALSPGLAAGMLPMAPGGAFFAPRPGMPGQPFFYPGLPLGGGGMAGGGETGGSARRPSSRPASRGAAGGARGAKKHCNCKNSRCLKLYCECFASGRYCDGCNCLNCYNNREHEATRQAAVEAILERNPNAFRPKIAGGSDSRHAGGARHNKGCNCKKSGCLKKYCECFQAGIVCSDNCKCLDCKNYEGSEARDALVSPQGERGQGSPMGLRRGSRGSLAISPTMASVPRPGFPSPGSGGAGIGLPVLAALQQGQAAAQPKALTAEQRQQVAREAMKEVIKPEVVEKLAMLLMVVSQEEHDRRSQPGGAQEGGAGGAAAEQQQQQQRQQQQDGAAAMEVDTQQQQQQQQQQEVKAEPSAAQGMDVDGSPAQQQDSAGANGVAPGSSGRAPAELETQEQLVLAEFRDTLQMISRVVGEKVENKGKAAQQPLAPGGGTPLPGMAGTPLALPLALQQLRPGSGGQPGAGMLMAAAGTPGQASQLMLLPQALMQQQMQQLGGMGLALQQTPQGLQLMQRALEHAAPAPAPAAQQDTSPASDAQ